MHIAAMKPTYMKQDMIPEEVKQQILDGDKGEKALKKYIKRDVLWEQELATSEKSMTVGKFLKQKSREMNTSISIPHWALFMID